MRMIRIVESYERGVYILRDSLRPCETKVGGIIPMLREAHQRVRGWAATVLVTDADGEVCKCLRYLPDGSVVEERPESIYLSAA